MLVRPKTHYLNQTTRRVKELNLVPELRRADHFLSRQLAPADRTARAAARLKIADEKITKKLAVTSRKVEDMRRVLEELHATDHNLTRSLIPENRAGRSGAISIKTRG